MSASSLPLEHSPITLVGDHIRTIAELEPEKPYQDASEHLQEHRALYEASLLTAAACGGLASGLRRRAHQLLGNAQDILASNTADQGVTKEAKMLDNTIELLAAWAQPAVRKNRREETITERRADLHHSTIGLLAHYTTALASKKPGQQLNRTTFGNITELTALGLLNRQQHPWLIATQALPHHDIGKDWRSNLDILSTESRPESEPRRFQTQCKSTCLGLCSDIYLDVPEATQERRNAQRARIAKSGPFIKEISGCCDLDIRWPYNGVSLPNLLVKENQGLASPQEVAALDAATSRLTLEISLPKRITPASKPITFRPSPKAREETRQEQTKQRAAGARAAMARIAMLSRGSGSVEARS